MTDLREQIAAFEATARLLETPPGERESAELRSWISPDPIREER